MKFDGEPYGLPRRGVASAFLLTFCALGVAFFAVSYASGELGSTEGVASALAIGGFIGLFAGLSDLRSAGRTFDQRVAYGRKLDRNSRRDTVIGMLIIVSIAFVDADFDERYMVGLVGAILIFTALFLFDRWVRLPRIMSQIGSEAGSEPSPAPDLPPERTAAEKDLRERWVFVGLWSAVIVANLIAAVSSERFAAGSTGEYGFGVFNGLILGGVVMVAILSSPSNRNEDGRFFGSSITLLLIAAMTIDDNFSNGPGAISTTALLVAASFGLVATIVDRWVALPRQLRGDRRTVLIVTDGGQTGLVHRGHVVAGWAIAISFSGTVVLIDAFASGIPSDALSSGLRAGLVLAVVGCALVAWNARGSYSERVARTANLSEVPVWKRMAAITVGVLAIVVVLAAVAPGIQAMAVAVLLASGTGLLATFVDRWIVTPRKLNDDRSMAFG